MKLVHLAAALTAAVSVPQAAYAFCGFYVSPGEQKLFNDATQVVLMRGGTRTVLSMQNNYQGPPSDFARVIPVPVVLQEADVKTLDKSVFDRVEQMGAPRLVEYWEQDPCAPEVDYDRMARPAPMAQASGAMRQEEKADLGVTIEAQFTVGEYQIVILSAKDSTGLDTWLRQENYKIPDGAEPLLRPYVESGMKFFVAKVDPKKVKFVGDRAELSPLRFHYDSDEFALPIRLGLANSNGTQDLIVNILAPNQRFEVANYPNVTIPTNLDVKPEMKEKFAQFYTSLFDRTIEKNPGAVVTEYAWDAGTCDPCPGPTLNYNDFATLGADVLSGQNPDEGRWGGGQRFVLTRLHARYGKDITNDLTFKAADAIVGGREHMAAGGKLEHGAEKGSYNNFQGRYAIRYPWTGPITCKDPKRDRWGGPPSGQSTQTRPAVDLAFAPRGQVKLAAAVLTDIPELGVTAGGPEPVVVATKDPAPGSGSAAVAAPPTKPDTGVLPTREKQSGGCCQTSDRNEGTLAAFMLGALWLFRRRPSRRK